MAEATFKNSEDSRPHFLVISVDHWPAGLLGSAGHQQIQTPTLDQIADSGIRFSNAYSECPVCIPARRTILTGTSPRTHGDRIFKIYEPMAELPTLPDLFRQAGYQTQAVGKLHVYPPRNRCGFEDVQLCEEGRPQFGSIDDYELYLGDQGLVGQQFLHGMSNNDYVHRPWHLNEAHHPTNWTARTMARMIQRRDPTRPGFWYLSFTHPHPPLVPLSTYLDVYREIQPESPFIGSWCQTDDVMPRWMNRRLIPLDRYDDDFIANIRRAFYSLCTHIDHQIRVVMGTLREAKLLDNTVVMFFSDHGDMLGNHNLWAKRLFYEDSAGIPLLLMGPKDGSLGQGVEDDRLVGMQDIMPTLLQLAEINVPDTVDGLSMVGELKRDHLYGEYGEGDEATRMIHDGRFKLIYYALGNRRQLFDLENDPRELEDLSRSEQHSEIVERLTQLLIEQAYGNDHDWIKDRRLVGIDASSTKIPKDGRHLSLQRGSHWPSP